MSQKRLCGLGKLALLSFFFANSPLLSHTLDVCMCRLVSMDTPSTLCHILPKVERLIVKNSLRQKVLLVVQFIVSFWAIEMQQLFVLCYT